MSRRVNSTGVHISCLLFCVSSTGALFSRFCTDNILECIGAAVGCLLSPPEKVLRRNGTRVQAPERISDIAELKALGKLALRKDFLLFPGC